MWRYLRDPTFSRFDTIPECDRHTHTHTHTQTDRQTDTRRRHILRLARRRAVKINKIRILDLCTDSSHLMSSRFGWIRTGLESGPGPAEFSSGEYFAKSSQYALHPSRVQSTAIVLSVCVCWFTYFVNQIVRWTSPFLYMLPVGCGALAPFSSDGVAIRYNSGFVDDHVFHNGPYSASYIFLSSKDITAGSTASIQTQSCSTTKIVHRGLRTGAKSAIYDCLSSDEIKSDWMRRDGMSDVKADLEIVGLLLLWLYYCTLSNVYTGCTNKTQYYIVKIYYFWNCNRFFTKFTRITEKDSGHVCSRFRYIFWFNILKLHLFELKSIFFSGNN